MRLPPSVPISRSRPWPLTPPPGKPLSSENGMATRSAIISPMADRPEPSTSAASMGVGAGDLADGLEGLLISAGIRGRSCAAATRATVIASGAPSTPCEMTTTSGSANSRRRWRQPPQGVTGVAAGAGGVDALDALAAAGEHGGDGGWFGAIADGIGSVLDIAADIDLAVIGEDGGADREAGIGRVGFGANSFGGGEQISVGDHAHMSMALSE